MQSATQSKSRFVQVLDAILEIWALLGFACAIGIIVLLVFNALGIWGLYLGLVALFGGPAGFFALMRRGPPVRMGPLLLTFVIMLIGSVGFLITTWDLYITYRVTP